MLSFAPWFANYITCHHSNFWMPSVAILKDLVFGLTVLLSCPKASSTFWLLFLSQYLVVWDLFFLLVCPCHCLWRYLVTFFSHFFYYAITICHTLQHVLGFSNFSKLNVGFFTSTFYFVFPFLKLLYELVLSMFNKHQFVSLGGECAFEVCLPSIPTSACFGSHGRGVLVWVNLIPSRSKYPGRDAPAVHQTCSSHSQATSPWHEVLQSRLTNSS